MKLAIEHTCECGTQLTCLISLKAGKIKDLKGLTECHRCGMLYEMKLQAFAKKKGKTIDVEHSVGE